MSAGRLVLIVDYGIDTNGVLHSYSMDTNAKYDPNSSSRVLDCPRTLRFKTC